MLNPTVRPWRLANVPAYTQRLTSRPQVSNAQFARLSNEGAKSTTTRAQMPHPGPHGDMASHFDCPLFRLVMALDHSVQQFKSADGRSPLCYCANSNLHDAFVEAALCAGVWRVAPMLSGNCLAVSASTRITT
jgi:hypothetical protein